jgi:predicted CXXCH cytochrome family protein
MKFHPEPRSIARSLLAALLVAALPLPLGWAQQHGGVLDTVHNLSAMGPGRVKAASELQVCIFCHAPHNTLGSLPAWNREMPISSYRIYESSTLDAHPGQPSASSKLCLSCHDGTIALGRVLSRPERIRMVGGDFVPAGLTNLGTDLSDDHPISFHYGAGLAAADRQLVNPASLPPEVGLDANGQVQCTSCHDPHSNAYGKFLVTSNEYGALCNACHRMDGWDESSHRTSTALVTGSLDGDWPFATVAANGCRSCHVSHGAAGPERLVIHEREEDNCLNCHNGMVAESNILAELDKRSGHDPRRFTGIHDPAEAPGSLRPHVECVDCHNPHASREGDGFVGYVPIRPAMEQTTGVTIGGAPTERAQHEYEVCLRCHGDGARPSPRAVLRQSQTSNLRLRFSTTNPSYHPIVGPVDNRDTVSLSPDLAPGSRILCTDCHNNDSGPGAAGSGPAGPHGSVFPYLLERDYSVRDNTVESAFDYALCYKCHQRTSILSDQSFPLHRLHVVDNQSPCSACHDPHGVTSVLDTGGSDHTHLINFDTVIVRPLGSDLGPLGFRDLGRYSGNCTLTCHGVEHDEAGYGLQAPGGSFPGASPRIRRIRPR